MLLSRTLRTRLSVMLIPSAARPSFSSSMSSIFDLSSSNSWKAFRTSGLSFFLLLTSGRVISLACLLRTSCLMPSEVITASSSSPGLGTVIRAVPFNHDALCWAFIVLNISFDATCRTYFSRRSCVKPMSLSCLASEIDLSRASRTSKPGFMSSRSVRHGVSCLVS